MTPAPRYAERWQCCPGGLTAEHTCEPERNVHCAIRYLDARLSEARAEVEAHAINAAEAQKERNEAVAREAALWREIADRESGREALRPLSDGSVGTIQGWGPLKCVECDVEAEGDDPLTIRHLPTCTAMPNISDAARGLLEKARKWDALNVTQEQFASELRAWHEERKQSWASIKAERDSYREDAEKWRDFGSKDWLDVYKLIDEIKPGLRAGKMAPGHLSRLLITLIETMRNERDRLQRENAELREALKLIRDCTGDGNAERVAENALAQLDASVQIPPPDPTIMDYVPGTEPRDAKEGE